MMLRGISLARKQLFSRNFCANAIKNNVKSDGFRRFWKNTSVSGENGKVFVKLDGHSLKTPSGKKLEIPTTMQPLAHLVALEWDRLPTSSIRPHMLPVTSLFSRAMELTDAENEKKRVFDQVIKFLDTDTVLVYAPAEEYEGKLLKEQQKKWLPLKKAFEEMFNVQLKHLDGDVGIISNKQSIETHETIQKWLNSLNPWQLAAFERCVASSKSFILSTLLLQGSLSSEEVVELTNLELCFQTNKWGSLEDAHDMDHHDLRQKVSSSALVFQFANTLN
ncbi:F1-ATPase chaperone Atp12 [Schizosaccharomyces cryophilus OY26]|uniref:F1-ATPase chaperone Atp12 n=1 Tax=Schizosaccharomyces cryophilus (strain OY26 / ATCC MYA-4695 / CBS 11777 / NBRC 106824 / NRRL Y48691) TaxID=653667 RepID=S9XB55_SCHCR|nr:F1-ATPase chaperone Atp12 [Schizosaccharomyces cryophilus OY26]EPY50976.1 F1-ATPase chaperone Atp12 [Schizosaccharomyces cryophilus OY26]